MLAVCSCANSASSASCIPVEVEVELGSLENGLGVCQGAGHAAEYPVVDLDQLVNGLRRHILSGGGGGGESEWILI